MEKLEAEVGELREELAGLYELLAGRARGKTQDCKTQDCKTQDPRPKRRGRVKNPTAGNEGNEGGDGNLCFLCFLL